MLRTLLALTAAVAAASAADPGKDAYGDPLPRGAVARLGTERLRNLDFYAGMQLMPDGKTLTAMARSVNTVFDVATGLPTGKVAVAQGSFSQAAHALSADGKTAVTVKYDGVDVWDSATGRKLHEIKRLLYGNEGTVALSADGKLLALGGQVEDKAKEKGVVAVVWNVELKMEIAAVKVAQNARAFVALSADGKTLVTWGNHAEPNQPFDKYDPAADPNRLVQIWDVAGAKEQASVRVGGTSPGWRFPRTEPPSPRRPATAKSSSGTPRRASHGSTSSAARGWASRSPSPRTGPLWPPPLRTARSNSSTPRPANPSR